MRAGRRWRRHAGGRCGKGARGKEVNDVVVIGSDESHPVFDTIAEKLEAQIDDLIAGGADETKLRALIRDALRAGSKS